ncbi:hypothetical protein CLG85_008955 [Yangia mangrovi]|uniref:STAS domain-containing protein n=1 Tax=Alloyangia mangrovi TaxID=1779329 RepID=A0A2A3JWE5_9RHOB|nr:hypothetical protein [Alloyangia mangrovi]MCA0940134.1 hypothetical protein [Alloyangia pacifica]MCA0945699.1 hypothetical protein [Alloyangia pacifica]MCT4370442.1 hypothetical protein [Alloyangia mangrovi]
MTELHSHVLDPGRNRNGEDPLVPFLLGARHMPVSISMRDVLRLDAHRLQILLVAQKQWQEEGLTFSLTEINETFRGGLDRLGLRPTHFDAAGTDAGSDLADGKEALQ